MIVLALTLKPSLTNFFTEFIFFMNTKLILACATLLYSSVMPAWKNSYQDPSLNKHQPPHSLFDNNTYEKQTRLVTVDEAAAIFGHYFAKNLIHEIKQSGPEIKEQFKKGGEADKTIREAVDLASRNMNRGIQSLLHNNLMKIGAIGVATAASFFIVKYGIPLGFKMIERALMHPKLIIASSKKSRWESMFGSSVKSKGKETPMVFSPKLGSVNQII